MRFTKQAFVRFQLCLFLDHVKLCLILVDVWPRGAFVRFLSPKWATLRQEFIKLYLFWISANVEGLWFLPSDYPVTSGGRWLWEKLLGTLWCHVLYLLFRHNRSAYARHSNCSRCNCSSQNTCLHCQALTWVLEFNKVTALLFQDKPLCFRDRLGKDTISQSIRRLPLVVTFYLLSVLKV
jgi:hypothetical protein